MRLGFFGAFVFLATVGCSGATRYEVRGIESAQGADALIEVTEGDHGNRTLKIEVEHLLPPNRVRDSAQHYAVWIRHNDRPPVHAANLMYDEEKRSGGITAFTPHRVFTLSITAEALDQPIAPSEDVVFRQQVNTD